ncbi:MAG TPA: pantoate--beta-alanine ligase [Candidatus Acidoferrales bacterium]
MEIVRTIPWMKQTAKDALIGGRLLGLVPTMGALHEGHFSLVRKAKRKCSPVAVSIFVNPTQFGPNEDLKKYPRTFEADRAALENLGVDILFAPTPEEMYPAGFSTTVSVKGLSEKWEGRARPGHFDGVATVVLKLLEIVKPQTAFFGRKDAQQAQIIRRMAADLNLDAEIELCPIVREFDGLALSSRNVYLKPDERQAATIISKALAACKESIAGGERDVVRLLALLRGKLESQPLASADYAEIVDAETFEPVRALRGNCYALIAAKVGGTRLIDNAYIETNTGEITVAL